MPTYSRVQKVGTTSPCPPHLGREAGSVATPPTGQGAAQDGYVPWLQAHTSHTSPGVSTLFRLQAI